MLNFGIKHVRYRGCCGNSYALKLKNLVSLYSLFFYFLIVSNNHFFRSNVWNMPRRWFNFSNLHNVYPRVSEFWVLFWIQCNRDLACACQPHLCYIFWYKILCGIKNFKLSLLYRSHFEQKAKYENETNTNRSESIFVLTGVSWPVQRLLRKTGRSLLLTFQALLFTSVSHFTAFVAWNPLCVIGTHTNMVCRRALFPPTLVKHKQVFSCCFNKFV